MTRQDPDLSPGERRAWGWVAHLREGGATPWHEWTQEGEATGRMLPGAAQLELLRRLNGVVRPAPDLAGRVLSASAPGRGNPDLQLVGVARAAPHGPRPVDPGQLAAAPLFGLVTGLLAEDLAATDERTQEKSPFPRPWARNYRLLGDPGLADPLREWLVARGRPPGGRKPIVLVLGGGLDRMLAHVWTARCLRSGALPWGEWVARWEHRHALPTVIDLPRVADVWSGRVGADRVHVMLDRSAVPRLLRCGHVTTPAADLPADAVELARQTGAVLGTMVAQETRARLVRDVLVPRLAGQAGPPLGLPPESRRWVLRRARRMHASLLAAGYAVHGDPVGVLVGSGPAAQPTDAGALEIGIRLLCQTSGEESA